MNELEKIYPKLITNISFEELKTELYNKSWCVHSEPPTSNPKVITDYLGKYICRIGLSKQRFLYEGKSKKVHLTYKDYRNHKDVTQKPPLAIKVLHPIDAMKMILQHCLPRYFQKCRYYGLHSSNTAKKHGEKIPEKIRSNTHTIRTVMQIITAMLGVEELKCTHCGNKEFEETKIPSDKHWISQWIYRTHDSRAGPESTTENKLNSTIFTRNTKTLMSINQGKSTNKVNFPSNS